MPNPQWWVRNSPTQIFIWSSADTPLTGCIALPANLWALCDIRSNGSMPVFAKEGTAIILVWILDCMSTKVRPYTNQCYQEYTNSHPGTKSDSEIKKETAKI